MAVALDRLRSTDVDSRIVQQIPFEEAAAAYRRLDERPESTVQVLLTYD